MSLEQYFQHTVHSYILFISMISFFCFPATYFMFLLNIPYCITSVSLSFSAYPYTRCDAFVEFVYSLFYTFSKASIDYSILFYYLFSVFLIENRDLNYRFYQLFTLFLSLCYLIYLKMNEKEKKAKISM